MPLLVLLAALLLPTSLVAQQIADSAARTDTLTRRPRELHEITVTATPVRRSEPATTNQVSAVDYLRVPAINPYEALRQTAGLEVHDQGQGPGFASDASVRGFSSDHSTDLALWVDGVPVNEPVNGHAEGYNDWSLLFPAVIQDINVVTGPTSPFYGNFALAGAINVRTLERMRGTSGSLSGGSYARLDGSLLSGVDREGLGGVLGLRGLHDDGWRPHSGYDLGQGHARLVHDLSGAATLDAGVELYAAGWDSPGFITVDQFDRQAYDTVANLTDGGFKRRAQERVSLRVVTGSGMVWRSTVYATQGRWQLFLTIPPEGGAGEGTGSQTEEEDTRYGFGATSAATWNLGPAVVTVGGESRWDHADYENWLTTDRSRDSAQDLVAARQASGALFLQTTSDLGPRFRVAVGGRYDVLGTRSTPEGEGATGDTRGIFSPKVGVLYHVLPSADLYGNVSRGFRQTDGVITDPALPLITAWAYETGIKINRPGVDASLAIFRTDVSNEQTFDPIQLESTSGGQSRRQGIDADLHARLSSVIRVGARATITEAKYRHLITEEGDTLDGARVFNTAKFVASGNVELAPETSPWHLGLATNLVGPYTPFDEPGVELPTYALFHLTGGVLVGAAQIELGVRNLFDKSYPEVRAGGFVSPGQPRSMYGTVRYVF
ncbi:MAG TPA: TonB-dependent receptor [Gemmatimonadales bacterium]|nr:TonB-dependent receptor [Gemmatimonadales bacterium]